MSWSAFFVIVNEIFKNCIFCFLLMFTNAVDKLSLYSATLLTLIILMICKFLWVFYVENSTCKFCFTSHFLIQYILFIYLIYFFLFYWAG